MGHNLKYTTHTHFIHTINTTLRYIDIGKQTLATLKPILCIKGLEGICKFYLFFFFEFSIYTHPTKFFIHTKTKKGERKRELIWARMARNNLKPIP